MSARDLPARPDLDHLKREAKALHKSALAGDAAALQRVRAAIGERPALKLTDAQRVIAREYGFPTWARLRAHVHMSGDGADAIAEFIAAVQAQDRERATRVARDRPQIATQSLHVAAPLGLTSEVERLVAAQPDAVRQRVGEPAADPLLLLCWSPFHGESAERDAGLLASARLLLEAGADPNTRDSRYGVPALYGVTGMHSVLPIARLLLAAGANPTDGESVFHAAEHFHEDALELLLEAGVDLNYVGEWGNTALYFLLRWWDVAKHPRVHQGLQWLLAHGADPNVRCGTERENALHVAARRGQSTVIVRQLLDHGADIGATRGDGSSAWLLARRSGFDEIAEQLESAGAQVVALSPVDTLLAACGRGDVEAARRLTSPTLLQAMAPDNLLMLPEAAAAGRTDAVLAYIAAGFPIDTADTNNATALHHAALHGRAELVRALVQAGATLTIRDREHSSTPLGWALFGADYVADPDGDYVGSVRALLEAGARPLADEYLSRQPQVRAVLDTFVRSR